VAALDEGGPQVVLAHPRADLIDPDGTVIRRLPDDLDLRSPLPWKRVADFTRNSTWRNPGLGMIRTDVLRSTGLIRPYYCSDHVLLVELALQGQIHEIPEWLFFRRIAQNSLHERPVLDPRVRSEVAHWFDTQRPRHHFGWKMRIRAAMLGVIMRSELGAVERARCAMAYLSVGAIRFVQVRRERIGRRLAQADHRRRAGADAESAEVSVRTSG
jgi:hypothetical protein